MAAAGVLIFERGQRRFEAALKRGLAPEVWVRPCKTLADVREQLQSREGCLVVISLDGGAETAAVLNMATTSPLSRGVLVIARSLRDDAEWLLREIGVNSVLYEPVSDTVLAAQCRRLLPTCRDDPLELLLSDALSAPAADHSAPEEGHTP